MQHNKLQWIAIFMMSKSITNLFWSTVFGPPFMALWLGMCLFSTVFWSRTVRHRVYGQTFMVTRWLVLVLGNKLFHNSGDANSVWSIVGRKKTDILHSWSREDARGCSCACLLRLCHCCSCSKQYTSWWVDTGEQRSCVGVAILHWYSNSSSLGFQGVPVCNKGHLLFP